MAAGVFFCQPWLNGRRTLTTSRVLCSWCTDVHSRVETRDQLYTFNTAAAVAAAVAAAHSKWENGGGGLVYVQQYFIFSLVFARLLAEAE